MRISRSGSPASLPPLDSLLPMEKSWALEAEREECMLCEGELIQSDTGVEQRDSSCCWTSSKRLHIGKEVYDRRGIREAENTTRWVSKISNPRLHKHDGHATCRYDESSQSEMASAEWRSQARGFTSASRCYPPNEQARSALLSHTSETRQECSMKGKRASSFRVDWSRSGRKELECKPEDHSFSGQDGLSEHGRRSRNFSLRQNRVKCNYGEKFRLKGNQENKESLGQYECAMSKRHDDAAAYDDFIGKKKRYDNAATYDDAIKKRYDNAAAYHVVSRSASKENPSTKIASCSIGSHMLESQESHVEVNQGAGREQDEMLASSLHGGEYENFDAMDDTMPHLLVSMDIDADAEAKETLSMTLSVVSPAKSTSSEVKMPMSEATSEKSIRKTTQRTAASLVSRSSSAIFIDVTNRFELHAAPGVKEDAQETDAHRLSQRQRQIEYGKNTLGYERYTELVPSLKRKARDPHTPNPKQICSKRSWDGQIRKWRRLLHVYDPPSEDGEEIAEDLSVLKLQRGFIQEANFDGADDSTLSPRMCDTRANRSSNAVEEKMGMEDGNLTIYDDWMES